MTAVVAGVEVAGDVRGDLRVAPPGAVSGRHTANHSTEATVAVGTDANPQSVVVHSNGPRVFVACAAGKVVAIDTASNGVVSEVDVWPRPSQNSSGS